MNTPILTFDTAWMPDFDFADGPARASVIILSTPRTGSQTLCRLLYDAGLGVPAEYFLPRLIEQYSARFREVRPPETAGFMKDYTQAIRERRCRNGWLSYKIHADQHRQLSADLGYALEDTLHGLSIIRLARRDVVAQTISLGAALQTGIWDDSSSELHKRPSALSDSLARKWAEYIFRSESYWNRYIAETRHPFRTFYCEDMEDTEKLEDLFSWLGANRTAADIRITLDRLPRYSHNRALAGELLKRFGGPIKEHWTKLAGQDGLAEHQEDLLPSRLAGL